MIVAFVTLLLGLTAGPRTIEVAVAENVARVELVLDGTSVGVLTGEPWSLEVDLGDELQPHRLVAVARDRAGTGLGRAEQWISCSIEETGQIGIAAQGDPAHPRAPQPAAAGGAGLGL